VQTKYTIALEYDCNGIIGNVLQRIFSAKWHSNSQSRSNYFTATYS